MKLSYAQVVAVLAALFAANICYHLLGKHVRQAPGPSWFSAGCTEKSEPGGANCAAVLQSKWSYWPPKVPDESPPRGHVPVAFLGLVYYGILAVWFLGIGRPSRARWWIHVPPLLLIVMGLAASGMFLFIMFAQLEQWCPWCVVTHVLNGVIAVCAVVLWPRRDRVVEGAAADDAAAHVPLMAHPSWRLVVTTVIACALVVFGFNQMQAQMNGRRVLEGLNIALGKYVETFQQLTGDGQIFVLKWQQAPPTPITLRADDPRRTSAEDMAHPFGIVVYSDFGCPQCRKLAQRIDEKIQPLFGGNLLVWFKHYPLDTACNSMTTEVKHPHACDAARMAEAARALSGNPGFWIVHDYLFAHQEDIKLGGMTPERVAELIGVDAGTLRVTMQSEEITQRLREDTEGARAAGLPGTPGVYINDRRVEFLALENLRFWDHLADQYWRARNMERPESTRLPAPPATPSNPSSSAVP